MIALLPGDRVRCYYNRGFINDSFTPAKELMLPATVLRFYSVNAKHWPGMRRNLIDVQFDHDPRPSLGHFETSISEL